MTFDMGAYLRGGLNEGRGLNQEFTVCYMPMGAKCNQYDFCKCYQNPLGQLLKLYDVTLSLDYLLLKGWYRRNLRFSRFSADISASFLYFFIKSFL